MTLTIKTNGKMTGAIIREFIEDELGLETKKTEINGELYSVEFSFDPPALWSDLEFWLEDENGKFCDYAKMNLSKRNKMQFSK